MEQIRALGIGGLIALLVLIAAFVLLLVGRLDPMTAGFYMALALARLL